MQLGACAEAKEMIDKLKLLEPEELEHQKQLEVLQRDNSDQICSYLARRWNDFKQE